MRPLIFVALMTGCTGSGPSSEQSAGAACADDDANAPSALDSGDSSIDSAATSPPRDAAPPENPCAKYWTSLPEVPEETFCTAVITLVGPTRVLQRYHLSCGGESPPVLRHQPALDQDGARLFLQAFLPRHTAPTLVRGFSGLFAGAITDPDAGTGATGSLGVVDARDARLVLLVTPTETSWPVHLYETPPSSPLCLPTTFPEAIALNPELPEFDDAFATTVLRGAWNSTLGYRWGSSAERGGVFRQQKGSDITWYVIVPLFNAGGI